MGARGVQTTDTETRFWSNVHMTSACWLWTGRSSGHGYGRLYDYAGPGQKRSLLPHRYAYENLVGPIPEGLQIDHLCRNRACVRPDHMEPVTARENTLRGRTITAANAEKTHCVHGHPLAGENLRTYYAKGRAHRACRTCNRLNMRAHRARKKVV